MALTVDALLSVAGERSYTRGEGYVRYVRGLRVAATSAQASVGRLAEMREGLVDLTSASDLYYS